MYRKRNNVVPAVGCLAFLLGLASAGSAADLPRTGRIRFEIRQIADDYNEGCAVADVNRDGKPDIIAGPDWYEGPTWKRHPLRFVGSGNDEFRQNNGDHAIDLNGDGWVDVISASWFSDRIYWYENPGKEGLATDEPWTPHLILDGRPCCEGTIMADMDGDGVPDLVPNSWDEGQPAIVIGILPGKAGKAPVFKVHNLGGKGYGHGIGAGDINGDGKMDVLTPKGWYEQPAAAPFEKPWPFHPDFEAPHSSLPNLIVDVNGDGRNDLIIGHAHDYGLAWYEQGEPKDGKTTWTRHEIDKSFSQVHCLAWADLDGDGRPELITGKRWRGHKDGDPGSHDPVCLFRFVWDPASRKFEKDVISFDQGVGTGMQIRVADLDGDGKPDIAVAGKTGTYVLLNRGPVR